MRLTDRVLYAWYHQQPIAILRPLAAIYSSIIDYRRAYFLNQPDRSYRAPVPVIIVGNITVGGTGKTPLILWLIDYCRRRGWRVGVVSRGYRARPPRWPWLVQAGQTAIQAGDEALLIAERSGVPVMIDPNRPRAIQALLAQQSLDLILSDDGLQHYAMQRDLELVMIDQRRGLGNRCCLPAGPLREPAERLNSVDAVLMNGAAADTALGYGMQLQPSALVNLRSGERQPLNYFPQGQTLHALAGIGHPQRFYATLEKLHWKPIPHGFTDHACYQPRQLHFTPALPLVMTEKDAVKCRAFAATDWWYLAVQAQPSPAFIQWFDQQLLRFRK